MTLQEAQIIAEKLFDYYLSIGVGRTRAAMLAGSYMKALLYDDWKVIVDSVRAVE